MPESSSKGGRKPRVTDADLLDVFRETPDPVLSTAEVSDALPIKRRGTLNRLRALEAEGALDSKTVGGRNTVWWLADREERRGTPRDAARSDPGDGSGDTVDGTDDNTRPESDVLTQNVREYLEGTSQGPKKEHARDAVLDVFAHLREHGATATSDLKTLVYQEYGEHYGSEKAAWESVRRHFDAVPGIEKVEYGTWGYAGDEDVRGHLRRGRRGET